MSRCTISLKSRVLYDGRVHVIDRRSTQGADLEKLPDPIWRIVGLALRSKAGTTVEKKARSRK